MHAEYTTGVCSTHVLTCHILNPHYWSNSYTLLSNLHVQEKMQARLLSGASVSQYKACVANCRLEKGAKKGTSGHVDA
jgi:hypothetical protein